MNLDSEYLYSELSDNVINCFYKVYNTLGFGFLEKIYQKSLEIELNRNKINFESQYPVNVYYDNLIVGEFYADILVEKKIILEIKAIEKLVKENENQLINYLKSTDIQVGLLLNFGKEPEVKRRIYTNDRKQFLK
jgi:GxxExxY protein